MIPYRALAQSFQKKAGISFEDALAFIAFTLRAAAHQLDTQERAIFKRSLPIDVRQVIGSESPRGTHDGRQLLSHISTQFDLNESEAKRRTSIFLAELRAGASPWDEVAFLEIVDRLREDVEKVLVGTEAA